MIKNRRMALAALLWMGVIFYLSSCPDQLSSEQSGFFVSAVMRVIRPFLPQSADLAAVTETVGFLVRKCAHMLEYAVLICLLLQAVRPPYTAFLTGIAYAALDEFHQTFVSGRAGQVRDVLIDTAGMAAGLLIYTAVRRLVRKKGREDAAK